MIWPGEQVECVAVDGCFDLLCRRPLAGGGVPAGHSERACGAGHSGKGQKVPASEAGTAD